MKNFIYFLNKKLFNGKILSNIDDDNNILILFYTIEDLRLYFFRGKNVSKTITDNETDDLLIYRKQSIKKIYFEKNFIHISIIKIFEFE